MDTPKNIFRPPVSDEVSGTPPVETTAGAQQAQAPGPPQQGQLPRPPQFSRYVALGQQGRARVPRPRDLRPVHLR